MRPVQMPTVDGLFVRGSAGLKEEVDVRGEDVENAVGLDDPVALVQLRKPGEWPQEGRTRAGGKKALRIARLLQMVMRGDL